MKYKLRFDLIVLICFVGFLICSCQNSNNEVISSYPDGSPAKVVYFRWVGDNKTVFKEIIYSPSGDKQSEGELNGDKKHGEWTYWNEDGTKWMIENYKNGIKDGETKVWFRNGKMNYKGYYKNGRPDGEWYFWNEEGKKIKKSLYRDGTKTNDENL